MNCTLECVSIYFRIRAQVAYILIMPLANCQQLNDSIFFWFSVTSRKKIIPAQHIDKKIYSFKGNIREKKIHAARKFPPPPPPPSPP